MANALDSEMYGYFMQLNDAEKKSVVELLKTFMKGRKGQSERISVIKLFLESQSPECSRAFCLMELQPKYSRTKRTNCCL